MKLLNLLENDVKGDKVTDYPDTLYHITDYTGVSHIVSNNALTARNQPYVSVTYGHTMRSVGGRSHYDFRFILDGKKLLETYEGNYYTSYARTTTGELHWYDEEEIGIQTKQIKDFSSYCVGMEILISLFSRSFIQWLFYETNSIKGIESLYVILNEWQVPFYSHSGEKRKLTSDEIAFLNECYKIREMTFEEALPILVDKFDIGDFFGTKMSSKTLNDESIIKDQMGKINKVLTKAPIIDLDENEIKQLVAETLKLIDPKYQKTIATLEKGGLFSKYIPPIKWSILFREISKNKDYSYMDEMGDEVKKTVNHFKEPYMQDMVARQKHTQAGVF